MASIPPRISSSSNINAIDRSGEEDEEIVEYYTFLLCELNSEAKAFFGADFFRSLRDAMREGVQKIKYTKGNGDERVAYGTRCEEIINRYVGPEEVNNFKKIKKASSPSAFVYFDIERRAWRSFNLVRFKAWDRDNYII